MIDILSLCEVIAREHKIAEAIGDLEVKKEVVPGDKKGFDFLITYVNNVEVKREYVKNEEYQEPDGDYLNPIPFQDGIEVVSGKFYTDSEDIWEAIKDGHPSSFADTEYFDIVA